MKTITLPGLDLPAPNVVLGAAGLSSSDPAAIRELVSTALDEGITFFDNAAVYGRSPHDCETLFGSALRWSPTEREKVILQSKTGIHDGLFDSSREHILESVNDSLAALRTDYLDILLLHRPDVLVEPDEVAAAFDELHASGKVRHFGVSNHTPRQIDLLKRSLTRPLLVNQMRLGLAHASMLAPEINDELSDQAIDRDGGILDYSRLNDLTLQAWSPFRKKTLDGVFLGDREGYPELNDVLDELAATYGVTPAGIAVAWITRHPANIQVVVGAETPGQVREAAAGSDIPLTRHEWYRLFHAAGYRTP